MKKSYYLLGIEGGVEPTVHGPYDTIDEQENAAKQIHREQEDDDSLFWAEVINPLIICGWNLPR